MTKNGFTLIEVVVALAVLAIGVVGLLIAHHVSLAHRQKAWGEKIAAEWAEQKFSEITARRLSLPQSGEARVKGIPLRWTAEKRELEKGFSEWSLSVYRSGPAAPIRLVTWLREKRDEKADEKK